MRKIAVFPALAFALMLAGCTRFGTPGREVALTGDEIIVAGQMFHTGTRVITWMDPGGYDAYRVERRFAPFEKSDWETSKGENKGLGSPNRYGLRRTGLTTNELEQVRGGGWPLDLLREKVDQFVLHFDVCGTSRQCFKVLHDIRCLSVHFMLDADGTIYQTLDLKERAWHASSANSRSIGIEIANIGAYGNRAKNPLDKWYQTGADGKPRLTIPPELGPTGFYNTNASFRPARSEPVTGKIQNQELVQYDFTPEQYRALVKLTAALCRIFPNLPNKYPADAHGNVVPEKLPDAQLDAFQGILGHYHVQRNKVDPGPAFQWEYLKNAVQQELNEPRSAERGATPPPRLLLN